MPNQGDGWEYTLGYLERHLDEMRGHPDTVPEDVHGGYLALVQTLALRTAQLHQAFALTTGDAAFDPEPGSAADAAAVLDRVLAAVDATFDALAAAPALPSGGRDDAQRCWPAEALVEGGIRAGAVSEPRTRITAPTTSEGAVRAQRASSRCEGERSAA